MANYFTLTTRETCLFTNHLLFCFNFPLFILSIASFIEISLLWSSSHGFLCIAFVMVSVFSLLSSFVGFYSYHTYSCFLTHFFLALASFVGQILSVFALFFREKETLSMLNSACDPKNAKVFVRLECGILMAMCILQFVVLMINCAVCCSWVKDNEDLEAKLEAMKIKMSRKIAEDREKKIYDEITRKYWREYPDEVGED